MYFPRLSYFVYIYYKTKFKNCNLKKIIFVYHFRSDQGEEYKTRKIDIISNNSSDIYIVSSFYVFFLSICSWQRQIQIRPAIFFGETTGVNFRILILDTFHFFFFISPKNRELKLVISREIVTSDQSIVLSIRSFLKKIEIL